MEKVKKKKSVKRILAITLAVILSLCALAFAFAEISFRIAHNWRQWTPDYEMKELMPILAKAELTDEDYAVLYEQTGLTKLGVDGLRAQGQTGRILSIQEAYFHDFKVTSDTFAPYTCIEVIDGQIPTAEVEPGDIVVSDTTHVFGFRLGHATLVLDEIGHTLEAFSIGTESEIAYISAFTTTASFMILRPKFTKEERKAVAEYAKEELVGVPYSLFRGIFTKKFPKTLKSTQCAHIVWYAYKQFGFDLDSDGRGLVTPQDLANSKHVELVQVYGFNPKKLWK